MIKAFWTLDEKGWRHRMGSVGVWSPSGNHTPPMPRMQASQAPT